MPAQVDARPGARAAARRLGPLVALLVLCAGAGRAAAFDLLVRWQSSPSPNVTGYRVWVRPARAPYSAPRDAGLPAADATGALSFTVTGLAPLLTYFVAVSAYTAAGDESPLSNEGVLGTPAPCYADNCFAPTVCDFGALADGTPCGAGSPDPCSGACAAGTCTASSGVRLGAQRLTVIAGGVRTRLAAAGSFTPRSPIDPTRTGVALELYDLAGAAFYRGEVPAGAIRARRPGSFVFTPPRRSPPLPGLTSLTLRTNTGGTVSVSARALAPELTAALAKRGLVWALWLGTECASDLDLQCTAGTRTTSCH